MASRGMAILDQHPRARRPSGAESMDAAILATKLRLPFPARRDELDAGWWARHRQYRATSGGRAAARRRELRFMGWRGGAMWGQTPGLGLTEA